MAIDAAGQKPTTLIAEVGPFIGVRDAVELSAQDPRRASEMFNCYVQLPELGGDVMQRAGFIQRTIPQTISSIGSFTGPAYVPSSYITPTGVLTNLMIVKRTGTGGLGSNQDYFQFGGNAYLIVKYDAPATYALIPAAATVAHTILDPATAANRFFQTALGEYAIFQQSGGKVYLFDYALGNITIATDLSDNVYGRPCIYYGKAFFILASDRSTIVWSEENDPDIGYQATGYDNFWTFRQTSNAPIMGLAGTNQYLYVFRQNSITSIEGAVNSDFRSFGTLEGVSTTVGTLAPDSIVNVNDGVWFLDQNCRPHAIIPGRGLVPLWENMAVTLNSADLTPATQFENWARFIPGDDVVVFRVGLTGGSTVLWAFSSRTLEWLGVWSLLAASTCTYPYGATSFSTNGRPSLLFGTSVNQPLDNFATQKPNTDSNQSDETTVIEVLPSPVVYVTTPKISGDADDVMNVRSVTATGQSLAATGGARNIQIQVAGSNSDMASATATTMTNLSSATRSGAVRYTCGKSIMQTRWVQAKLATVSLTASALRFSLGIVRIYGTKQRNDPELP